MHPLAHLAEIPTEAVTGIGEWTILIRVIMKVPIKPVAFQTYPIVVSQEMMPTPPNEGTINQL